MRRARQRTCGCSGRRAHLRPFGGADISIIVRFAGFLEILSRRPHRASYITSLKIDWPAPNDEEYYPASGRAAPIWNGAASLAETQRSILLAALPELPVCQHLLLNIAHPDVEHILSPLLARTPRLAKLEVQHAGQARWNDGSSLLRTARLPKLDYLRSFNINIHGPEKLTILRWALEKNPGSLQRLLIWIGTSAQDTTAASVRELLLHHDLSGITYFSTSRQVWSDDLPLPALSSGRMGVSCPGPRQLWAEIVSHAPLQEGVV